MRRALRLTLFAALLGAISTIAVAWWCGWQNLPGPAIVSGACKRDSDRSLFHLAVNTWRVRGSGVDRIDVVLTTIPTRGDALPLEEVWPWWIAVDELGFRPPEGREASDSNFAESATALAQGWPLAALWCTFRGFRAVEGGILLSRESVPKSYLVFEHVLAFRPIWRGFALDAALYGLIWFALLFAPGIVRRAHRRRRNRCERCGYDLRGTADARCPECGSAIIAKPSHQPLQ